MDDTSGLFDDFYERQDTFLKKVSMSIFSWLKKIQIKDEANKQCWKV